MRDEYFGDPERANLTRRAEALWRLVGQDPRFAFYGRLVALSDHGPDVADVLAALARVQGGTACYFYPKEDHPALARALERRGLASDRHEHFLGRAAAYAASRSFLDNAALPADLTLRRLDRDSPADLVAASAALQQSCEVMPVPGSVMRGLGPRGVFLAACDGSGAPVACAASFLLHPPSSRHADIAFWGMIATRPDRRGQRLARLLGAHAIVHMWENEGARGFMTGVRADNASSRALCEALGVVDSDWCYVTCTDPGAMGAKITR